MITGKIDAAKPSKSGKTLGVKVNGTWYSTSEWELQQMVGQEITITETKAQDLPGGGSITYLNAYTVGDAMSVGPAPSHQGTTAPSGEFTALEIAAHRGPTNELLLGFVGHCMSSFQWQTSDVVAAKTRAKQSYELGQSILDGSIMVSETGPRTRSIGYQPMRRETNADHQDVNPDPEPQATGDDFDDDIPF